MSKAVKICVTILFCSVLVTLGTKVWADRSYYDDYNPLLPFNTQVSEVVRVEDSAELYGVTRPRRYEKTLFTIETRSDEPIPVIMTLPVERSGRLPVIILLHGIGQSKSFLERICTPFNENGFAMVCFDQHMQGERKVEGNALNTVMAFRQRPWKTINDTRRLIDYLQTHPEIDPERIYLTGVSYGALAGTTAIAFDHRIRAAGLVVGGGNIPLMLEAPLIKDLVGHPWLHWAAKHAVSFMMKPAEPLRFAEQSSGRPVLMQNASEDILITPDAGVELFNALGEPKEIRWYPCDHPGIRKEDGPVIAQMLDEGLAWMLEQDRPFRESI